MAPPSSAKLIGAQNASLDMYKIISQDLLERPLASMTSEQARPRYDEVTRVWKDVLSAHQELASRNLDPTNPYLTKDTFRELRITYDKILDLLAPIVLREADTANNQTTRRRPLDNSTQSTGSATKIPRMELPRFDGTFEGWQEFADLFKYAVHDRRELSDAARLQFLKSSVSGVAAAVIRNFKITDVNYKHAWDALQVRFTQPRLFVRKELEVLKTLKLGKGELGIALCEFIDEATRALQGMRDKKLPVDSWNIWVVDLLSSRLDTETRTEWEALLCENDQTLLEESIASGNEVEYAPFFPTFEKFAKFVTRRANTVGMAREAKSSDRPRNTSARPSPGAKRVHHTGSNSVCPLCNDNHTLGRCDSFEKLQPTERRATVARLRLCYNCLGNHLSRDCTSKNTCRTCQKKHHTKLHSDDTIPMAGGTAIGRRTRGVAKEQQGTSAQVNQATVHHMVGRSMAVLATAIVIIEELNGASTRARALLDQGSEVSLIAKSLVQLLGLRPRRALIELSGVGSSSLGMARSVISFRIRSPVRPDFVETSEAYILPNLTSRLPACDFNGNMRALEGLTLADPLFNQARDIDLIIGAGLFAQLLRPGFQNLDGTKLVAQDTVMGWIVSGAMPAGKPGRAVSKGGAIKRVLHNTSNDAIYEMLKLFWELEEPTVPAPRLIPDEEYCEHFFRDTCSRDKQGRFLVNLPFKGERPRAAVETRLIAMRAFRNLRTKMQREPRLARAYREFMATYENLGHMERVPTGELNDPEAWYLPHHAVVSPNSDTYKIRVVFDASRRTSEGRCLNDYLLPGPPLQRDLILILLNWRRYRVVFTADIIKMFRQIQVAPRDCEFQRILWSARDDEAPVDYRLTTVTYGTTCAPYLAIKTLLQVAQEEVSRFPLGSQMIRENTYVDDVFAGADTLTEALTIRRQLIALLQTAGIELGKWAANNPELLPSVLTDDEGTQIKMLSQEGPVKTLGVQWEAAQDSFTFYPREHSNDNAVWTKRAVLSRIARLFDPLGWIAPVIIPAKIIMQDLCVLNKNWDEHLDAEIEVKWKSYLETLADLTNVKVERWLGTVEGQPLQLHGFCDASKRAYAAAVYLRVGKATGEARAILLSAKTKVSPLKTASIPNLELCGAVLLVDLITRLQGLSWIEKLPVFLWCDNETVLAWLNKHPASWKTFVANRVAKIQTTLPAAQWSYVASKQNPADIATRGMTPRELSGTALWWYGPSWLKSAQEEWPKRQCGVAAHHVRIRASEPEILTRFSTLSRLVRVIAYCLRLVKIYRRRKQGLEALPSFLTVEELTEAQTAAIILTQAHMFKEEISMLKKGKELPKGSSLCKLRPFVDTDKGVLRVGGRLAHSDLDFKLRHPPILPAKCTLSRLVVRHAHKIALHGGPTSTSATLIRLAWILGMNRLIKSEIRNCVTCQRAKPRLTHQLMGDLPAERVTPARPFSISGLDYAGPFRVRTTKGRGFHCHKGYVVLFVCFSTRAIHLEIVSDLSTDSFLAAFRRFISRRGICHHLFSDNATTFKGADAELKAIFRTSSSFYTSLCTSLANVGTRWTFIPPSTPHYGGLWEAGVRSMKHHLQRIIKEQPFTFEDWTTLLAEVEACLNSRPLRPMSSDPEDIRALTPAHFLLGGPAERSQDVELTPLPDGQLRQYHRLQLIRNQLWQRWSGEYVQHLQERSKWRIPCVNYAVGQLVILKDDRFPPGRWPLGRIVQTHAGPDGLVRVVSVKTATTTLKRHIAKVASLFAEDSINHTDI